MHVGKRWDDARGLRVAALVEQHAVRVLQMLDCLLGLAEMEVQATEVVEQSADVSLVVDLLVVGLRALSVISRLDPVPHPLADERSLEVRVRGLPRIVERLRELESALDVLARGFEVPLPAVAPRAPAEDVGAQAVARKL